MADIPDAVLEKAAAAVHQRCIEMWREREKYPHAGITKHGPETHLETARVYLEAVWDDLPFLFIKGLRHVRAEERREVAEEIAAHCRAVAKEFRDFLHHPYADRSETGMVNAESILGQAAGWDNAAEYAARLAREAASSEEVSDGTGPHPIR